MRTVSRLLAAALAVLLAACGGNDSTGPKDLCPTTTTATTPTTVSLAVGQSQQLLDAAALQCVRVAAGSARYVMAVTNTNRSATNTVSFQVTGASAGALPSVAPPEAPLTAAALFGGAPSFAPELAAIRRRIAAESRMLELNRTLSRGMPNPRAAWSAERARRKKLGVSLATGPSTTVGAFTDVRILNRDDPGGNLCSNVNYISIRARTVYANEVAIVLEDSLDPLAGQVDTTFKRLADEFRDSMLPILKSYYGDPLALDAELDNNQRVVMVFSHRINDFGDIAGFVLNCDFFPRTASNPSSAAPVSNEGEYFYAYVPDSLGTGVRNWDRGIRPTLIHEVKHVTSNAARFTNPAADDLESRWLEEATAVHAEEIWGRTQENYTWKGNATYANTIFCEVRPSRPECARKPSVVISIYDLLYDYLAANESHTPLGAVKSDDFTFYGSGWSLVRWAADQYATSEPAFFKALTQAADTGIVNLEKRTGRPWPEMDSDWTLALATDDRGGFTPSRAQLTIPSWNTRDIFAGLNTDFKDQNFFTRVFPLQPRTISYGALTQSVIGLRGGSAAIFELTGTASGSQVLELSDATGKLAPPSGLVMQILRIQ